MYADDLRYDHARGRVVSIQQAPAGYKTADEQRGPFLRLLSKSIHVRQHAAVGNMKGDATATVCQVDYECLNPRTRHCDNLLDGCSRA